MDDDYTPEKGGLQIDDIVNLLILYTKHVYRYSKQTALVSVESEYLHRELANRFVRENEIVIDTILNKTNK